jgi:ABC-type sugar transport system ATPase subunit
MTTVELVEICKTLRQRSSLGVEYVLLPGLAISKMKENYRATGTEPKSARPFFLQDINLVVPDQSTLVILGPSGCGKTTLLRIIAGLIQPDSGTVRYDGADVSQIPPGERHIGMVFQNYALYPHLTSNTNILAYFFFRKKTPELDQVAREKYQRTSDLMGVDIRYLLDRKPSGLSAGEKQRVALARCITREPKLFLLDEPFSNLDQRLREKYRVNLRALLKQFSITTVYVTHDQQEALILADLVAVMETGRIAQVGTYKELYDNPKNIFVAEFLNPDVYTPAINLLDGEQVSREYQGMRVGVRPSDIRIGQEATGCGVSAVLAQVAELPIEGQFIVAARLGEALLHAHVSRPPQSAISERVWLGFQKLHVFDKETGLRARTVS